MEGGDGKKAGRQGGTKDGEFNILSSSLNAEKKAKGQSHGENRRDQQPTDLLSRKCHALLLPFCFLVLYHRQRKKARFGELRELFFCAILKKVPTLFYPPLLYG